MPEYNIYHSQYTIEQIENSIGKSPIVQNGTWWTWDISSSAYVDTGVIAEGTYAEAADTYAVSSTAAGTAAKVATPSGSFTLSTGVKVSVKFSYANTASSPTLNFGGTGAKAIKAYGTTAAASGAWVAGQIVQFEYDGTNWLIVGRVPVDPTLSVSGAAADAAVVGKAIIQYNAVDLLFLMDRTNVTVNGVTFTWNGNSCAVSGSSTGVAINNIYVSQASVEPFEVGETYSVAYSATNVGFQVYMYENGVFNQDALFNQATDGTFTIPATATGILVRLRVPSGRTVDETVTPVVMNTKTNKELDLLLQDTITDVQDAVKNIYVKDSGSINDINDTVWLFADASTVSDLPSTDRAYFVLTLKTSNTNVQTLYQIAYDWTDGTRFTRRAINGTFTAWSPLDLRLHTKYVAFGDSVWYGAVWTDDSIYQAATSYQIPTRVAKAIGFEKNFSNESVGGTGYCNPGNATTITEKVLNYNFTNVEVATFAGGVNDKPSYTLGTRNATAGDGTICGAIKQIISHMATNYPRVQLIFIQPTPSGHLSDPWAGTLGGGWSINDFNTEVGALCEAEHVTYVPLTDSVYCKQWDSFSGGTGTGTSANYSHFRAESDYAMFGDYIAGKVSAHFHGNY